MSTTRLLAETAARRAREALEAMIAPWVARLRDDPTLFLALCALPFALLVGFAPTQPAAPVAVAVAPTPPLVVPTIPPEPSPTPDPRPVLPAAAVAYAAPGGAALGALESGRVYQPLARWGADYVLCEVQGSGAVWLRVAEVGLPSGALADLQPPAAPVVVYVAHPVAPVAPVVGNVAPAVAPVRERAPTRTPALAPAAMQGEGYKPCTHPRCSN